MAGWEAVEVDNQLTEEHSDDNFCEGSVVESIG